MYIGLHVVFCLPCFHPLLTFPPSAPATNPLGPDILQHRFPRGGSGLPSSSVSAPVATFSQWMSVLGVGAALAQAVVIVGQMALKVHSTSAGLQKAAAKLWGY